MGLPMGRRLLDAGNNVIAWNRSATKLESLVRHGAIAAESPAGVMLQADLIGLCLTSHQAVEEVAWGPEGLFSGPQCQRKVVVDFSTGSPEAAAGFAKRAAAAGASWVDAPVSGGVPAATAGTLIVFAGGEPESLAAAQPLLAPLTSRVTLMGPAGSGQTTKICNQMIVACGVLLMGEMMALARKAGLDVDALPAALKGGFADSLPLQIFGPRMAAHRFEPRLGAISLMEKDINLASVLSMQLEAYSPMLERARELYAAARLRSDIHADADISSIVCLFESVARKPP
jgi:3-hydroxyisobutyrate dehydrogenase-like beta-hydroxyacid dehydrogenase